MISKVPKIGLHDHNFMTKTLRSLQQWGVTKIFSFAG